LEFIYSCEGEGGVYSPLEREGVENLLLFRGRDWSIFTLVSERVEYILL